MTKHTRKLCGEPGIELEAPDKLQISLKMKGVDYLITRNARHFPQDMILVLSPIGFLALTH